MSELVHQPSLETYSKFLSFVHERGKYGDADYPQISKQLQPYSASDLQQNNAVWHRNCYKSTCNSQHLQRVKIRYQRACEEGKPENLQTRRGRPSTGPAETAATPSCSSGETLYTHSAAAAASKEKCFFCQKQTKDSLHEVSSFNAGKQLKEAVQKSNNQQWKVQLSAAITADDARAIDVKYHLKCWVQNVQRNKRACDDSK